MKRLGTAWGMLLLIAFAGQAQTRRPARAADSDRLGMTCTQILKMTSPEWVEKFAAAKGSKGTSAPEPSGAAAAPELTIRAIEAYGKCYDARTEHLAATLGRAGKGPLMGARGDFGEFEKSLKDFEEAALANVQPPASATKKAYAALYEKHFRYDFYMSYTAARPGPSSAATAAGSSAKANTAPPTGASQASSAPKVAPGESSSVRPGAGKTSSAADEVGGEAADDTAEEFTKAKNRFGQLLEALPEDNARAVHSAFGRMLGAYEVSQDTRLNVYLYAIFLLEPDSAKPFAPAPF